MDITTFLLQQQKIFIHGSTTENITISLLYVFLFLFIAMVPGMIFVSLKYRDEDGRIFGLLGYFLFKPIRETTHSLFPFSPYKKNFNKNNKSYNRDKKYSPPKSWIRRRNNLPNFK